jgi:hypothetical protein
VCYIKIENTRNATRSGQRNESNQEACVWPELSKLKKDCKACKPENVNASRGAMKTERFISTEYFSGG